MTNAFIAELRRLRAAVPEGTWQEQSNMAGFGVMIRQPDDFINVCWWDETYEHTEPCRDLIIASVEALPALLDIASLASKAMDLRNHGDPNGQLGRAYDTLTHALSLLCPRK